MKFNIGLIAIIALVIMVPPLGIIGLIVWAFWPKSIEYSIEEIDEVLKHNDISDEDRQAFIKYRNTLLNQD